MHKLTITFDDVVVVPAVDSNRRDSQEKTMVPVPYTCPRNGKNMVIELPFSKAEGLVATGHAIDIAEP